MKLNQKDSCCQSEGAVVEHLLSLSVDSNSAQTLEHKRLCCAAGRRGDCVENNGQMDAV